MRATIMYGAGDVRVGNVPDVTIVHPTTRSSALPALHLRHRAPA